MTRPPLPCWPLLLWPTLSAVGAAAGDATPAATPVPVLAIELNAAQPVEAGCRLTFVATNGLGADLASGVFEAVFFTRDGLVAQMSLLDFRDLPQGRMRVRQFDLPGVACPDLGRVLLNAAARCEGAGVEAGACMARLKLTSRIDAEVAG